VAQLVATLPESSSWQELSKAIDQHLAALLYQPRDPGVVIAPGAGTPVGTYGEAAAYTAGKLAMWNWIRHFVLGAKLEADKAASGAAAPNAASVNDKPREPSPGGENLQEW